MHCLLSYYCDNLNPVSIGVNKPFGDLNGDWMNMVQKIELIQQ